MATDKTSEAYSAVIDFSKTVISITSTILAAEVGYLVFQDYDLTWHNSFSAILLIISIFLSLFCFGSAIESVKDSNSRPNTMLMGNGGAFFMIAGIICLIFISKKNDVGLNEVLINIEKSSFGQSKKLDIRNCYKIQLNEKQYNLNYKTDSLETNIVYSLESNKILSFTQNNISQRFNSKCNASRNKIIAKNNQP